MRISHRGVRLVAIALVLVSFAPSLNVADAGYTVQFPRPGTNDTLQRYNDTVFVGLSPVNAVSFAPNGDIWYASYGGVVHERVGTGTRDVFTRAEGLPESVALDIAVANGKAYVGTDLGLAVIDTQTGGVTSMTPGNSALPDPYIGAVAVVGDRVFLGTGTHGIAIWNTTSDTWFVKNTSTSLFRPEPVIHFNLEDGHLWAATSGDGGWRWDFGAGSPEANASWFNMNRNTGLFNDHITSVQDLGADTYFAGPYGLARWRPSANGTADEWRRYTTNNSGLPHQQVNKLDVVPNDQGIPFLIADTRAGVWEYDPQHEVNFTMAQPDGLFGAYVVDDTYGPHGWAFATQKGVSVNVEGTWTYYTTGPGSGPSNGPGSYRFTSGGIGDSGSFLWFGRPDGITAYKLPTADQAGRFYNFGAFDHVPGGVVTWIDTEGTNTWFATMQGAYGYDALNNKWIATPYTTGISYGVAADASDVWISTFGDGLYKMNITTGAFLAWNHTTAPTFPDLYLTDARLTSTEVWLGASTGVLRLNRLTGAVVHTYAKADGLPGDGFVYRTLPDEGSVWLGMRNGGVARLDVGAGKVAKVWNATTTPGFPDSPVNAMLRDGRYLWVGTQAGLVRIDVTTSQAKTFDVTNGLVQEYVTGLSEADGILYLSTYSGIARLDTQTLKFLPMQDGVGVVRVGPGATGTAAGIASAGGLSVRIDAPADGSAVAGRVEIRGTALRFGGSVDRVEVRLGEGDWQTAQGTESWSYAWDTSTAALNTPIQVSARAVAGNLTSPETEILVTPVAPSTIPLTVKASFPASWTAGRDLPVTVHATGDEPLAATLYYEPQGATTYVPLPLQREGSYFSGTIPGHDLVEGNLTYYAEARSGLLTATSPDDITSPSTLPVLPAPKLGVTLSGPASLVAKAGVATTLPLTLTNIGTDPVTVKLAATGLRASWARLPADAIALAGGESRVVNATLDVPAAAFADNTSLVLQARDVGGVALPASATVPVQIVPADIHPAAASPAKPSPGFALPAAVGAVAVALLLRRRRA